MDYLAIAQSCLDFNKNLNRIHVTMDGTCFPDKQDGINHARTVTDASIKVYERHGDEIVEVTAQSTAETIEANTHPNPEDALTLREDENINGSGEGDLKGQANALADLILAVQNAKTVAEVDNLVKDQTNTDLLAVAHARRLALNA